MRSQSVKICIFITSYHYINFLLGWPLLRFFNLSGSEHFGDLRVTILGATCNHAGDLRSTCPEFLYGSPLKMALSKFPFSEQSLHLAAFILIFCFVVAWSLFISDVAHTNFQKLVLLSLCISPPFQFLIERGNIDLVIFSIVYICFFLFMKKYYALAFVFFAFAILAKYYVLPLVYLLVSFIQKGIRRKYVLLLLILTFLVYLDLSDISKTRSLAQTSSWASFGFQTLPHNLNSKFGISLSLVFFLEGFLILLVVSLNYLAGWKYLKNSNNSMMFSHWAAVIYLSCYFAGISYDYRLIFLAAAAPLLTKERIVTSVIHSSLLIIVFFGCFANGSIQTLGDLIQLYFVARFISQFTMDYSYSKLDKRSGNEN